MTAKGCFPFITLTISYFHPFSVNKIMFVQISDSYISALLDFRTTYSNKLIIRTSGEPARFIAENFDFNINSQGVSSSKNKQELLNRHAPILKYEKYLSYCEGEISRGKIDEPYIACVLDHFGSYSIKIVNNKLYPSIVFNCPNNGVNEVMANWLGKKYLRSITLGIEDIKLLSDNVFHEMWIRAEEFDILSCSCWERTNVSLLDQLSRLQGMQP